MTFQLRVGCIPWVRPQQGVKREVLLFYTPDTIPMRETKTKVGVLPTVSVRGIGLRGCSLRLGEPTTARQTSTEGSLLPHFVRGVYPLSPLRSLLATLQKSYIYGGSEKSAIKQGAK